MTVSEWLTAIGVAATVVSMLVSIWQARSAFASSQVARSAMTSVQISVIAERLKSAQEHIRELAADKVSQRGFKVGNRFDLIRREFDTVLNTLPKSGEGGEARIQIKNAQAELNIYQQSMSLNPDIETWQKLQTLVQDAISDLTSMSSKGQSAS